MNFIKTLFLPPAEVKKRKDFCLAKQALLSSSSHLSSEDNALLKDVILEVHPADDMFAGNADHYLQVGFSAVKCIDNVLSQLNAEVAVENVLDLPSGYGRVLRFLRVKFPKANITACDLDARAVKYCAAQFNAHPIQSHEQLSQVSLGVKHDLIWCGSLATHLNQENNLALLKFFSDNLSDKGVCVISTQGTNTIRRMNERSNTYGLSDELLNTVVADFGKTGYGYVNYPHSSNYGIAVIAPDKFENLANRAGLKKFHFEEEEWDNHHDIFGFQLDT